MGAEVFCTAEDVVEVAPKMVTLLVAGVLAARREEEGAADA